jgi:hypothetical protein
MSYLMMIPGGVEHSILYILRWMVGDGCWHVPPLVRQSGKKRKNFPFITSISLSYVRGDASPPRCPARVTHFHRDAATRGRILRITTFSFLAVLLSSLEQRRSHCYTRPRMNTLVSFRSRLCRRDYRSSRATVVGRWRTSLTTRHTHERDG